MRVFISINHGSKSSGVHDPSLFGWRMWQGAVSRPVSWKVARALDRTPTSIGLLSKVPNQEFIMKRQVLALLPLEYNAVGWFFLRKGHLDIPFFFFLGQETHLLNLFGGLPIEVKMYSWPLPLITNQAWMTYLGLLVYNRYIFSQEIHKKKNAVIGISIQAAVIQIKISTMQKVTFQS